jgi:hypothetical protein
MGSERRKLAMLETKGITGEGAYEVIRALETLECTGDSFSDALFQWDNRRDGERAIGEMQEALLAAAKAVEVVTKAIHTEAAASRKG